MEAAGKMTDKTDKRQPPPFPRGAEGHGHSPRQLVCDGHVMRGIVRNMVVNMECVLSDLQGIMGDIQSLVTQIDTVTEKIDKQCGADGSSCSQASSQHCVRKPRCVHGSKSYSDTMHHVSDIQAAHENVRRPFSQQFNDNQIFIPQQVVENQAYNIKHMKTRYKDSESKSSSPKQRNIPRPRPQSSEVRWLYPGHDQGESKLPTSSRSFSFFPKSAGGINSPSGGIAIVHPTILHNPSREIHQQTPEKHKTAPGIQDSKLTEDTTDDKKAFRRSTAFPKASDLPTEASSQVWMVSTAGNNELQQSKHVFSKQKHRITSVYNKSFQPVTPTDQQSPGVQNVPSKVELSSDKHTTGSQQVAIPEASSDDQSPHHKYCSIGGSLPSSPSVRRSAHNRKEGSFPNSPRLQRSSSKRIYCKIDGSPASSSTSSIRIQQPKPHNYYYSIESDLDSDALLEYHDPRDTRSMTPDIDWSYLGLVGNRKFQSGFAGRLSPLDSNDGYEVPVNTSQAPSTFQMLQTSPDVVSKLPVFHVHTFSRAERFIQRDSRSASNALCVVEKVFSSPVVAHVFCNEVSAFEEGGYCGCYEALLDSVLENVGGFESFEEAIAAFDSDEAVDETYVSFDDDFEEDEWDVGMRPEEDDSYEIPCFIVQSFLDDDSSLFGSFELDDNRNIFGDVNIRANPSSRDEEHTNQRHTFAADSDYVSKTTPDKRLSLPLVTNEVGFDFPSAGGNSFTDDDCCAIKPNITGQHDNFILWPKSFVPSDVPMSSEGSRSKDVSDMEGPLSSSDDTSCQAVGGGSPMSFSSPEAAVTSPDTDRFMTSSEGDDLFTSQEESFFLSSEARDNANVATQRTNMRQLRREFFESLYSVCERRERERNQENLSRSRTEESASFDQNIYLTDNNRESLSEAGSYHEDVGGYNKNVNTWTAYAMVHVQADDVSDSASDIMNDNNVSRSMTSSYIDADNIGTAPPNQGFSF